MKNVSDGLQKLYKIHQVNSQKNAMSHIENYTDEGNLTHTREEHRLGFTMGTVIIALAALLFFKQYHSINI